MSRRFTSEDTNMDRSYYIDSSKRLFDYLKDYKIHIIALIVLTIITSMVGVLSPYIMGSITNYVLDSFEANNFIMETFVKYIGVLLFMFVLRSVVNVLSGHIEAGLTSGIVYKMRKDVSEKTKTLPMSFFDTHTTGDILSVMTNDIQTVADSLEQILLELISSAITIVGIIFIMLYIHPLMAVIVFLVVPVTLFSSTKIVRSAQAQFRSQWKYLGELNGYIEEMFSSAELIKSYNYQEEAVEQFTEYNTLFMETSRKAEFTSGILMPVSFGINNFIMTLVGVVGGIMVLGGSISIGNLQAFIQYTSRFVRPISNISNIMGTIQSGIAASNRVFSLLDEEEDREDPVEGKSLKDVPASVSIDDLYFGYEKDQTVLKGIDLQVSPGESIAIVGATGSGKTTLIKLLMGFYEPDSGSISIGGVDIQDVEKSELRDYTSIVLQNTWLFNGTVADNIAYGNVDCTRDDIEKAARYANAHHFIERLSHGYDTMIEEGGSNISQGERQLLTIARALISNPNILILDEATSSVDTRTEALIQKGIDELIKNRTSFIVAHRLSTIVGADRILVMDNGKIIEQGPHEKLMEENGYYKDLYMSQYN